MIFTSFCFFHLTFFVYFCTVPMWAIGAIVVVVLALVGCFAFCIYKKCLGGKKKAKKVRERKGGRRRMKKEGEEEAGEVKDRCTERMKLFQMLFCQIICFNLNIKKK